MVAVILVDSNIWLFVHLDDYPEHPIAKPLVDQLLKDDVVATNAIVISEVYHKLSLMLGRPIASAKVGAILASECVRYLPLGKETTTKAVPMAARFQLRINDALIGQHAIDEGASVLTDDTRAFRKIKDLHVVPLRAGKQ